MNNEPEEVRGHLEEQHLNQLGSEKKSAERTRDENDIDAQKDEQFNLAFEAWRDRQIEMAMLYGDNIDYVLPSDDPSVDEAWKPE